jgi:hypothetical protein
MAEIDYGWRSTYIALARHNGVVDMIVAHERLWASRPVQ